MDNEEELVDVNANLDETENVESGDSDESLNTEGEDNTPAKKNKSNFKKLKVENKSLKKTLNDPEALRNRLAELEGQDPEEEVEEEEDEPVSTQYAPIELKVLFLENPSAKDYEDEIRANLKKYPDMDFDDAFKLAKADKPVSETKRNLSLRSTSKPKDISSLSQEEALKLPEAEYLKWARATGNVKE